MPTHAALIAAMSLAAVAGLAGSQAPYRGHGAGSVPPEKVAQYAPPPLPADIARAVEASIDVRAPGGGRLSPDGRRMYFTWTITGTPHVWRVDGPGTFPVQMTGGDDRTSIADVTPDGRWLVIARDVGGQEDPGLYLQPAAGGPLRLVHHKPRVQTFYEFTAADSRAIYYRANDRSPTSYAIYRHDIAANTREEVLTEDGLWSIADHREADGVTTLLLAKATGSTASEYYRWTSAARVLEPLFGQGERTEFEAAFSADADELVVVTNKFGDFRRLYRWRKGEFTAVSPEEAMDVSSVAVDEARRRVYYTLNDKGYGRARVLDARTYRPIAFPEISGADQVSFGSITRDGRFVTVFVGTPRAPVSSYVYDWDTSTMTQWVLPSAPEIDTTRFAVPRLESYPARDGTSIPMFVRYPAGCEPEAAAGDPCPVVVEFHGGPEGQARPAFSPYAQLLVDAGFIVAQPNVRGSDGYGRAWLDADNGPKRLDIITDIEDAGRFLRQRHTRNGEAPRMAITGGSYGGYSTLIGMTMFAGTYDVGVSTVGISNLLTFLENTAPYRRMLRASEYGDPVKDREALVKLSPTSYLDRVKGALLLIQGVDDPRVPAGEAIQLHEALTARGLQSQLILLVGEGHGAGRRSGQVVSRGHTLRFLKQHLLGAAADTSH